MVDWTKGTRYSIENVEHQIHILGVKTPVWPYVVASFIFSLWICPLFFFVGPTLIILIARKFWESENKGRPIEYDPWFYKTFGRLNIISELFPCIPALKHSEYHYR